MKRTRLLEVIAICSCMLLTIPLTSVHAKGVDEQTTKPLTVLAMLKAESDLLAKWQAQKNKVVARTRPKPSLLSIYGVMPQLRATVLLDGREIVFEQGREHPLQPKTKSVRLRNIKPPCVSFFHGRKLETICMSRVGS